MKRRSFLATAAAGAALAPAVVRAQKQTTLKFIPQIDLAFLDPHFTTAYITRNHSYMVFDTLYGVDGNYKPQPQMVQGHTVENDAKLWKLTLRDGMTWHDGEKVLARDCTASIKRWAKRDSLGDALMQATDELSAPDDKTIQFRLKRPFPLLPDALGKSPSPMPAMMPERLANTDAFTQIKEIIGSGPYKYKMDERVQGSKNVYERFAQYKPREDGTPDWTAGPKRPWFDRIEWTTMPDPATSLAALQRGEIDWLDGALSDHLPILRRAPGVKTEVFDQLGNLMSLFFNHYQAPFDNPKLRRAVLAAVSQQDFVDAVLGDEAKELGGIGVGVFPPKSPFASKVGLELMPANVAAAKKMVAESGYKGEKVVLMSPTDIASIRHSSLVADSVLKSIGLNVEFASMDWGTMIQRRNSREPTDKGGWSCYTTSWTGLSINTPATHLPLRANGAAAGAWWRPTLSEQEKLRDAWFDAPDLASQKTIAEQIQRGALENAMFVPLGLQFSATAFRTNLTGFARSGSAVFWGVRKTA